MKKYLFVFLISLTVPAMADIEGLTVINGTISWTEKGWMQVQDSSTYETMPGCEGPISSCDVPNGTYIVINHFLDNRQENIQVVAQPTMPPVTSNPQIYVIEKTCDVSFGAGACSAFCPSGIAVAVMCGVFLDENRNPTVPTPEFNRTLPHRTFVQDSAGHCYHNTGSNRQDLRFEVQVTCADY